MKYHFIDIGCGHQSVSSDIYGTSDDIFGIYVEPIKEYLDVLPTGKHIFKEHCAIYKDAGEMEINAIIKSNPRYFSNKEMSDIVGDPVKLQDYLNQYKNSGQSSFLTLDPTLPVQKIKIKTMSLEELFSKYNVTEVENIKIDVEGAEEVVLLQLCTLLKTGQVTITNELRFEYTDQSDLDRLDRITKMICKTFGFTAKFEKSLPWNEDMVCTRV